MACHALDCVVKGNVNRVISVVKGQIVDIDIAKATKMPRKKNKMDILKEYKDLALM
ncbi:MAG: hypothetical protein K2L48_00660 [Mycoplasmoidaceae bacterium]|nr:hypothetical protein [Mycoplasmoidaceae bacterium]